MASSAGCFTHISRALLQGYIKFSQLVSRYLSVGHLPCPTARPSLSVSHCAELPGSAASSESIGAPAFGAEGRMRESNDASSQLQAGLQFFLQPFSNQFLISCAAKIFEQLYLQHCRALRYSSL